MNTEDSEFERIEREQAMRGVPDPIHHTDTSETLEYIKGWNDCRAAMLEKQPDHQDMIGEAQDRLIAEQAAQAQPTGNICFFGTHADNNAEVLRLSKDGIWANPDIPADEGAIALYTTPQAQPAQPLTDDELADLWFKQSLDWMEFARAIEAAHGIKENNT